MAVVGVIDSVFVLQLCSQTHVLGRRFRVKARMGLLAAEVPLWADRRFSCIAGRVCMLPRVCWPGSGVVLVWDERSVFVFVFLLQNVLVRILVAVKLIRLEGDELAPGKFSLYLSLELILLLSNPHSLQTGFSLGCFCFALLGNRLFGWVVIYGLDGWSFRHRDTFCVLHRLHYYQFKLFNLK